MKYISIANQKGIVGKTTTELNLGAGSAATGRNVLLVDLNPQASLTLAGLHKVPEGGMPDVLGDTMNGKLRLTEAIPPLLPGLDLASCNQRLSYSEPGFNVRPKREAILQRFLIQVSENDLALLSCGPRVGLLLVNALSANHAVICRCCRW